MRFSGPFARRISRGEVSFEASASFVNEILEFDCHVRFPQIAEVVRSLRIDRPSARLRGSVFGPPDTGLRSGFPWAIRGSEGDWPCRRRKICEVGERTAPNNMIP